MRKILLSQRYFQLRKISAKYSLYDESVLAGGNHFKRIDLMHMRIIRESIDLVVTSV